MTTDLSDVSHAEQTRVFCEAGASWVQIRSKSLSFSEYLIAAQTSARVCQEFGALFIVNDSPEIALRAQADGVHLGSNDLSPKLAREILGSKVLIGGTVNSMADAEVLVADGVCDYAGVGPFRYTGTKQNLAPVLDSEELRSIILALGAIRSFVIGGLEPDDVDNVLSFGAYGMAVCNALFEDGKPSTCDISRFVDAVSSSTILAA
ncbi:MAG: thiamine phosphate synthase [Opitutae bacterium]|nr:thiamine phosphate synthase [Opitutae bacterium]